MRTALLTAAVLIGFVGTAEAGEFIFKQKGVTYTIAVPSPEWFQKPLVEKPIIKDETPERVDLFCTAMSGKREPIACTRILPGWACEITINEALPKKLYKVVLHHEMAHCHGWPADHPAD